MEWRGKQAIYQSQYLHCFADCFLFVSFKKSFGFCKYDRER